ncbi:MAG TPA: glycosyltransferase family 9 protein [Acidimicrobiales bacterium]|nr:glycosyltransferase family 9 protein [Acidimicrobiales bacterium]
MSAVGRRFIAPVSFGLGDLVVSLPVVQAMVTAGRCSGTETWLVTRSQSQVALAERIGGLAGTVPEGDTAIWPLEALVDLRDHPLQRDYWWGTPEFSAAHGALSINEIIAGIGADLGVVGDFSTPVPLETRYRPDAEGLVLFVADTDGTAKRWAPERWVELAMLLSRRGLGVAVVTRDEGGNPLVDRGIARLVAATPGDAVDVLSACRAVVGVDTGLTHIAAQQGTPTVTLCRLPPVYFRDWDHTRLVAGSRCDPVCQQAETEYAYNQRVQVGAQHPAPRVCPAEVGCLGPIEPSSVLNTLGELC